ncbi:glycosyl transferase, family 2 [Candidatus Velamenicoccus archaeovorus]|uniref:Glycosyl transferase, family 2 n=1 Tax=Velamenicoccus archaeovorus TaxID=1930593 RepID=A0A410P2Q4_VELA1|nr:glycosyltransferase [Candidatus Velamenicoccus archaeovorus]QAT16372.1 glycosyl transferase, family 2 [Candidatus Velamenicoccus archaeovorus]
MSALQLEILLPVYNESDILEENVGRVVRYLDAEKKWDYRLMIVDNGSTDRTPEVSKAVCGKFAGRVGMLRLDAKGRGRALRYGLLQSKAQIVGYMDIDLSGDLRAFDELYAAIAEGCDIAVGTRLARGSCVTRSPFRKALSCGYNVLVKKILKIDVSDAQCGFKLVRRGPVLGILPFVKSDHWCFDTELLFFALKKGLKVKEVPLSWQERDKGRSTVRIVPYVFEGLGTVIRLAMSANSFR